MTHVSRLPATTHLLLGLALSGTFVQTLIGQEPKDEATKLAKATQNPVADLVSIPFQFNFNTGGGFDDGTFFNLNFQPVVPVKGVLKKYTIIFRTIVPYVSIPTTAGTRQGGLGDIQVQLFATPSKSGTVIWGLGPIFSFPTATADASRTGSWAIGPTAVVLTNKGPWVLGGLINNLWTFSDNGGSPEVNQFLMQPFVNYNFGKGWALSSSPVITANWDASGGEEWTVPLGVGVSKTTAFNRRPMSLSMQYYHNVEHPTASAGDQLRLQISFLYPSAPPPKPVP